MTDVEPDQERQGPEHGGRTAWVGAQIATAQVAGERALAWGVDRVRGVECGVEAYGRERRGGEARSSRAAWRTGSSSGSSRSASSSPRS